MEILSVVSVALGLLMLAMTLMLYLRPELHVAWGVTILVFAAGSITSVFSGYGGVGVGGIGGVLGVGGGSLAIARGAGGGEFGMGGPAGGRPGGAACGRKAPLC